MLLRNNKVVTRPVVIRETKTIKENKNENMLSLKFIVLFFLGIMGYVYNYEVPHHDKINISSNFSKDYEVSVSPIIVNLTVNTSVPIKIVPKPDILFFSSNEYLTYNLSSHKEVLQNLLFQYDDILNRTQSMIFFAEHIAKLTGLEKNILVLVYEFSGGQSMEPIVYYHRPVEEIIKVFVVW